MSPHQFREMLALGAFPANNDTNSLRQITRGFHENIESLFDPEISRIKNEEFISTETMPRTERSCVGASRQVWQGDTIWKQHELRFRHVLCAKSVEHSGCDATDSRGFCVSKLFQSIQRPHQGAIL